MTAEANQVSRAYDLLITSDGLRNQVREQRYPDGFSIAVWKLAIQQFDVMYAEMVRQSEQSRDETYTWAFE